MINYTQLMANMQIAYFLLDVRKKYIFTIRNTLFLGIRYGTIRPEAS